MTGRTATVGVCGAAGTMGAGIAIVAARAGFPTVCHDLSADALAAAGARAEAFFARQAARGRIPHADDVEV